MRLSTVKMSRLEARVSGAQKLLFQQAADLTGVTLTDFMIHCLQEATQRIIKEHTVIRLQTEAKQIFVKALLNPPKPNLALLKAARLHRKKVISQ